MNTKSSPDPIGRASTPRSTASTCITRRTAAGALSSCCMAASCRANVRAHPSGASEHHEVIVLDLKDMAGPRTSIVPSTCG